MVSIQPIQFTVRVLHDTGSDALTLYERDLAIFDPGQIYPRSVPIPFNTANGLVFRQNLFL
ncbi:hypothetical protein K440DRAFT_614327 [Wilcoxina mikolae CBS 423.85]|nr:hypothetical protein K440DRAFT_614327 [Wilcoxina mikolae CBS 423.85]